MRRVVGFAFEVVFVGFLLNLTAGLVSRRVAIPITMWGWLAVSVVITGQIVLLKPIKRYMIQFRSSFGGRLVLSYVCVGLACAGLGMIYWLEINRVFAKMLSAPDLSLIHI